jgi:hypothetical protein
MYFIDPSSFGIASAGRLVTITTNRGRQDGHPARADNRVAWPAARSPW